ncbi:MAG: glycosyltransferase [Deltaproteobacteria bacterium]|nr:glycosyltransferase [Deltaproteobacteria bacterium]MBW1817722.1 glycosyltransferase [Deltaproteobacteria bacterium]
MAEGVFPLIDSMNPWTWIKAGVAVVRARADMVVIPWWVSFWAPQFWMVSAITRLFSKSKILFLCHNVMEHESGWWDQLATRQVLRMGHFHIVHSEEDRRALLAMLPGAQVRKSFHPTYDVFDFGHVRPERVRARYGLSGKVILFFGFVREYKGLKYLLRALPEVLAEIDVTLLVVGEFWKDKAEYIRLVDELELGGHVVLVDRYVPNEEVGDFFAASDLVVQPYTSATGSGVIQLAFGFGKPVVATRVGCLTEVISEGKTGYLVPPEAPGHLAKAILRFFKEDKEHEFSNNIRKENYRFSWGNLIDVIDEFGSG